MSYCHVQGESDCPICLEGLIEQSVSSGWTYGHIAMACVSAGNMLRLITMLSEGFDVNYQNAEGHSLLMRAALTGCTDATAILLERGADVTLRNLHGQNALLLALEKRNYHVADLIAEKCKGYCDGLLVLSGKPHNLA